MAGGDLRWIPQVPADKDGYATAFAINGQLRALAEMIYQLEGRRGAVDLRDTLSLTSDGQKALVSMEDEFINASFSFGGSDRKSFYISRGAVRAPNGIWLATDLSASILEWASTSGLNYYYNTGLVKGQSFTPTFQGNVGISSGTFVTGDRTVTGDMSISGGGDLSADRTFTLVNDAASPGANKVYGTSSAGVKGWQTANPPGAWMTLSGDNSQANGSWQKIPLNTAVEDSDSMCDTTNQWLECKTAGIYLCSYVLHFAANATGIRAAHIYKNGAAANAFNSMAAANLNQTCACTKPIRLAVGDTIELYGYQNSGGNLTNADDYCFLSAQWVRA